MKTKTLEIDARFGEEFQGKYVLREITWAKRSRIIQKYTKYNPVTGQMVSQDLVAVQGETVWAAIVEQPSSAPVTLERLLSDDDGVPYELGELLARVANELCGVTKEERDFLSDPSDGKSQTQQLQISDSQRNSAGLQLSSTSSRPKPSSSTS